MNKTIGVDCSFEKDGRVRVRRIKADDRWQVVEQGRQWCDEHGRHVLIMMPGGRAQEIILSAETLNWKFGSDRMQTNIV